MGSSIPPGPPDASLLNCEMHRAIETGVITDAEADQLLARLTPG